MHRFLLGQQKHVPPLSFLYDDKPRARERHVLSKNYSFIGATVLSSSTEN